MLLLRHQNKLEGSGQVALGVEFLHLILGKTGLSSAPGMSRRMNPLLFRGAIIILNPSGHDGICLLQCLAAYFLLGKNVRKLCDKTNTLAKCKALVKVPQLIFRLPGKVLKLLSELIKYLFTFTM